MVRFFFDPQTPVIVLVLTLEGRSRIKRKIDVALDTGATYLMIPWEVAEALGYNPELSREKVDLITASGVEKAPLVILKSATLLGKKVSNVKAVVHSLPPRSHLDGLLGLSFLRKFRINLDFKAGVLEID